MIVLKVPYVVLLHPRVTTDLKKSGWYVSSSGCRRQKNNQILNQ